MNIIHSIRPSNWKLRSSFSGNRIFILLFSFFFVFFQFTGVLLDQENGSKSIRLVLYIAISIVLSVILSEILLRINNMIINKQTGSGIRTSAKDKYYFLVCWGIITVCWLPYFLAYYPGIFSYDARCLSLPYQLHS